MFILRRPSPRDVEAFLATRAHQPLSYTPDAIRDPVGHGFVVDDHAAVIGSSRPAFERGRVALTEWAQSTLEWMQVYPARAPIRVGQVVAVVVRHLGFWSINGCRVTAVLESDEHAFGFVYGTLADHAECGEETFLVTFDPVTGNVSYSIRAISKPNALLARLGRPFTRILQARFRRDSTEAMERAVGA